MIDFSAEYDAPLARLLAGLPSPAELLAAEAPVRRPLRRPPRHRDSRWREWLVWTLVAVAVLALCSLVAIALGLIPV